MPNKRDVVIELEFPGGECSLTAYLLKVNTKEAIDELLEKANFKKGSISIGTIKEKKHEYKAGFLRQQEGL